jgi:phosphoribosylanthranilate isomerase
MMVKICGITTEEDARLAAAAGAGAVGFNFWPRSPRYVTPERAAALAGVLPAEVLKVGVFVDAPAAEVVSVCYRVPLDVAQLHGGAAPAGIRWWRASTVAEFRAEEGAEAVLVDTPAGAERGGTGRTFDWSLAAGLPGRIILAGGLGPDNVAAAIAAARPWGVDACSRLESAPGRKDPDKVKEFIRAARSAAL